MPEGTARREGLESPSALASLRRKSAVHQRQQSRRKESDTQKLVADDG